MGRCHDMELAGKAPWGMVPCTLQGKKKEITPERVAPSTVKAHIMSAGSGEVCHRQGTEGWIWSWPEGFDSVIGTVIPMGSTYIRLINLFSLTSLLDPPTLPISSLLNNLIKFPWNLAIIKKCTSLVWSVWQLHYSFILIVVLLLSFMNSANESWPQEVNLFFIWW